MRTVLLAIAWCASLAAAADYVVLDGTGRNQPFKAAIERLADHREAEVVAFDPHDLGKLKPQLAKRAPRFVALVMEPDAIDFNFQRRFLQMATELDSDPFVDFAYGYITGADGKEALALVEAGIAAEGRKREPALARVGGGVDRSMQSSYAVRLRGGSSYPVDRWVVAGEKNFPETGRDRKFMKGFLGQLAKFPALLFAGHGLPREVVGGPDFETLKGLSLDGTVVLNVACYTGVTHTYFERDWRAGRMERKVIPLEESFCLGVLRSGAAGYTAYLCPRPAGPELDCDLSDLMIGGLDLGTVRRRDYDKTVLGFVGYGEERMRLEPIAEGAPLGRVTDPVRQMMLEGATGGVLFGDPALAPFEAQPELHPVAVEVVRPGGRLMQVNLSCPLLSLGLLCSDPTLRLGKVMAHKAYARVPIGTNSVRSVDLHTVRLGKKVTKAGVVWAVEEDHGQRFLQLKVVWARGDTRGDLKAQVNVQLDSKSGQDVAKWGRQLPEAPPPAATPEPAPSMLEIAGRHKVSEKALKAALVATEATLGKGDLPVGRALDELAAFKSEGFRATCVLIEVGRHHYRTHELLRVTYQKGDERLLIALAARDLPDWGTWSALEGLGATGSPAARKYLIQRIQTERDAGLFMASAKGLALMKEKRAVKPVGEQLLKFEAGWQGVAPHLVRALGDIGDREAAEYLMRYCLDDRATQAGLAESYLRSIHPPFAERVARKRKQPDKE